ncbi:hypothetical protein X756_31840 [Mesorhizobium sp. LSHC412B00]|nr:hypothetical protein X756_31840 [Mesorhizobium sp. LSHC412B00]
MAQARRVGQEKAALRNRHEIGRAFATAGIWEKYADKATGELIRAFACEPKELMATINCRMPVILAPETTCAGLGRSKIPAT